MSPFRAVLFDVDFTLCRPGPELSPDGYVAFGQRFGLELALDRFDRGRDAALADLERHPELAHDDELWIRFAQRIVIEMGGQGQASRACAEAITLAWEQAENFELYPDVLPLFRDLRAAGVRLGLISNTGRDLEAFVEHHALDVDVALASRAHGKTKPDPSIFLAALERLAVPAATAAMVGDSWDDDVAGARAIGMSAFLVDREGRLLDVAERFPDLDALRPLFGLA